MKRALVILVGILAVTQLGTSTVQATVVTFDFMEGSMGNGFGNSITSGPGVDTEGELTARLTGWSVGKNPGNEFSASQVRRWNTGVGNCNTSEGLNCGSPNHAVDNGGNDNRIDVFLIEFSESVLLMGAPISAWAVDFDVSFWAGTGGVPDIDNLNLTELDALSLGGRKDDFFFGTANTNGSTTRTVALSEYYPESEVDWLVFGAAVTSDPSFAFVNSSSSTWMRDKKKADMKNDNFKFGLSVDLQQNDVPAPGVLFLLGAGALALGLTRRRKTSAKETDRR